MTTKLALRHHAADSNYFSWAKYDEETKTLFVCFPSKTIAGGTVYAYENVPEHVFENLLTAKDSTVLATAATRGPIGAEKAGSEGSYVIHHIVGYDRKSMNDIVGHAMSLVETMAAIEAKSQILEASHA